MCTPARLFVALVLIVLGPLSASAQRKSRGPVARDPITYARERNARFVFNRNLSTRQWEVRLNAPELLDLAGADRGAGGDYGRRARGTRTIVPLVGKGRDPLSALNRWVRHARGRTLGPLRSFGVWHPEMLQKMPAALREVNPGALFDHRTVVFQEREP